MINLLLTGGKRRSNGQNEQTPARSRHQLGPPEAAQQLLDAHATVDRRAGKFEQTALFYAVIRDNLSIVRALLVKGADDLRERGQIDLSECYIDGMFIVAKQGACRVGPTKRGRGTKLMALADAAGLPLAAYTTGARAAEVTHVPRQLWKRVSLLNDPNA